MTLVDTVPLDRIASDVHPISRTALLDMLQHASVEIKADTTLEAVTASGVIVSRSDGSRGELQCSSVVLAIGSTPRREAARQFEALCDDVRLAGDCRRPGGNLRAAITDGFNAAVDL